MKKIITPGSLIQYNNANIFYLVVNINEFQQMDIVRTALHEFYITQYIPCSISSSRLIVLK